MKSRMLRWNKCEIFQDAMLMLRSITLINTAKNTVISPNFLMWKFCGMHSFRIVSGESPETMRKLCLSTKFPHQGIRWNYGISRCVILSPWTIPYQAILIKKLKIQFNIKRIRLCHTQHTWSHFALKKIMKDQCMMKLNRTSVKNWHYRTKVKHCFLSISKWF